MSFRAGASDSHGGELPIVKIILDRAMVPVRGYNFDYAVLFPVSHGYMFPQLIRQVIPRKN